MKHIIVMTLVLNLVAGTAVFLYSLASYRKYRQSFLKTLLVYIISFNGLIVADFIYQYFLTNVFGSDMARVVGYPAVSIMLLSLVYAAEFGITVNLFRTLIHLKGREMSGTAKRLFSFWLALFGLASVYGLILLFRDSEGVVFYWIHAVWIFSMIIIILTVLTTTLAGIGKEQTDRNSLRAFASIFLAGYTAFTISVLDFTFLKSGFQKYYDPVVLLLINLCPIFWLRFFYEKKNKVPGIAENVDERLDRFCETFGISRREREIIQQVIIGKSNKEIEDILFISFNTVKNHIYNVYQKVGVNSRSELIHRINRLNHD